MKKCIELNMERRISAFHTQKDEYRIEGKPLDCVRQISTIIKTQFAFKTEGRVDVLFRSMNDDYATTSIEDLFINRQQVADGEKIVYANDYRVDILDVSHRREAVDDTEWMALLAIYCNEYSREG
jgi:hypothetical protein